MSIYHLNFVEESLQNHSCLKLFNLSQNQIINLQAPEEILFPVLLKNGTCNSFEQIFIKAKTI